MKEKTRKCFWPIFNFYSFNDGAGETTVHMLDIWLWAVKISRSDLLKNTSTKRTSITSCSWGFNKGKVCSNAEPEPLRGSKEKLTTIYQNTWCVHFMRKWSAGSLKGDISSGCSACRRLCGRTYGWGGQDRWRKQRTAPPIKESHRSSFIYCWAPLRQVSSKYIVTRVL